MISADGHGLGAELGLDVGIRRLSELNLPLCAILLLLFVLACLGPTTFPALESPSPELGRDLSVTISSSALCTICTLSMRSAFLAEFGGSLSDWAWWIAWSPFVGMFIARISAWSDGPAVHRAASCSSPAVSRSSG